MTLVGHTNCSRSRTLAVGRSSGGNRHKPKQRDQHECVHGHHGRKCKPESQILHEMCEQGRAFKQLRFAANGSNPHTTLRAVYKCGARWRGHVPALSDSDSSVSCRLLRYSCFWSLYIKKQAHGCSDRRAQTCQLSPALPSTRTAHTRHTRCTRTTRTHNPPAPSEGVTQKVVEDGAGVAAPCQLLRLLHSGGGHQA